MSNSPQKRKKYLIPIPLEVERALKHTAIARGLTISQTIVTAVTELAERDGWLDRKQNGGAPTGVPNG